MENSSPKGPTRASIILITGEFDGPDGLRMEVDFHGPFDPTSTAHNIIGHFRDQLLEEAARAQAAAEAPRDDRVRLLLPVERN
jgi:hypothetical protein